MNKQEAADFLGVSVRALERYVQQGKISVTYV
ncbi:MAG: helix-turn-helix domain-containing protein [Nostoc sp.]